MSDEFKKAEEAEASAEEKNKELSEKDLEEISGGKVWRWPWHIGTQRTYTANGSKDDYQEMRFPMKTTNPMRKDND